MKNIIIVALIAILAITATSVPVNASVEGITKDNYLDWVKPYPDAPGFNKGECDRPYLEGEEYFYNDYYDHWNVDKVYDYEAIPKVETKEKKVETKKEKVKTKKKKVVTDKYLVKQFCIKKYKMKPKYVKERSKLTLKRKSKKRVIVEVVKTTSKGRYGKTKDGYNIRYNKKVKKGKKVTCYLIYNPKNNAHDDVVAVVDNRKIRK